MYAGDPPSLASQYQKQSYQNSHPPSASRRPQWQTASQSSVHDGSISSQPSSIGPSTTSSASSSGFSHSSSQPLSSSARSTPLSARRGGGEADVLGPWALPTLAAHGDNAPMSYLSQTSMGMLPDAEKSSMATRSIRSATVSDRRDRDLPPLPPDAEQDFANHPPQSAPWSSTNFAASPGASKFGLRPRADTMAAGAGRLTANGFKKLASKASANVLRAAGPRPRGYGAGEASSAGYFPPSSGTKATNQWAAKGKGNLKNLSNQASQSASALASRRRGGGGFGSHDDDRHASGDSSFLRPPESALALALSARGRAYSNASPASSSSLATSSQLSPEEDLYAASLAVPDDNISLPFGVSHNVHVHVTQEGYVGLPESWAQHLADRNGEEAMREDPRLRLESRAGFNSVLSNHHDHDDDSDEEPVPRIPEHFRSTDRPHGSDAQCDSRDDSSGRGTARPSTLATARASRTSRASTSYSSILNQGLEDLDDEPPVPPLPDSATSALPGHWVSVDEAPTVVISKQQAAQDAGLGFDLVHSPSDRKSHLLPDFFSTKEDEDWARALLSAIPANGDGEACKSYVVRHTPVKSRRRSKSADHHRLSRRSTAASVSSKRAKKKAKEDDGLLQPGTAGSDRKSKGVPSSPSRPSSRASRTSKKSTKSKRQSRQSRVPEPRANSSMTGGVSDNDDDYSSSWSEGDVSEGEVQISTGKPQQINKATSGPRALTHSQFVHVRNFSSSNSLSASAKGLFTNSTNAAPPLDGTSTSSKSTLKSPTAASPVRPPPLPLHPSALRIAAKEADETYRQRYGTAVNSKTGLSRFSPDSVDAAAGKSGWSPASQSTDSVSPQQPISAASSRDAPGERTDLPRQPIQSSTNNKKGNKERRQPKTSQSRTSTRQPSSAWSLKVNRPPKTSPVLHATTARAASQELSHEGIPTSNQSPLLSTFRRALDSASNRLADSRATPPLDSSSPVLDNAPRFPGGLGSRDRRRPQHAPPPPIHVNSAADLADRSRSNTADSAWGTDGGQPADGNNAGEGVQADFARPGFSRQHSGSSITQSGVKRKESLKRMFGVGSRGGRRGSEDPGEGSISHSAGSPVQEHHPEEPVYGPQVPAKDGITPPAVPAHHIGFIRPNADGFFTVPNASGSKISPVVGRTAPTTPLLGAQSARQTPAASPGQASSRSQWDDDQVQRSTMTSYGAGEYLEEWMRGEISPSQASVSSSQLQRSPDYRSQPGEPRQSPGRIVIPPRFLTAEGQAAQDSGLLSPLLLSSASGSGQRGRASSRSVSPPGEPHTRSSSNDDRQGSRNVSGSQAGYTQPVSPHVDKPQPPLPGLAARVMARRPRSIGELPYLGSESQSSLAAAVSNVEMSPTTQRASIASMEYHYASSSPHQTSTRLPSPEPQAIEAAQAARPSSRMSTSSKVSRRTTNNRSAPRRSNVDVRNRFPVSMHYASGVSDFASIDGDGSFQARESFDLDEILPGHLGDVPPVPPLPLHRQHPSLPGSPISMGYRTLDKSVESRSLSQKSPRPSGAPSPAHSRTGSVSSNGGSRKLPRQRSRSRSRIVGPQSNINRLTGAAQRKFDQGLPDIVKPAARFLSSANPDKVFGELTLIGSGESGEVYSAAYLGNEGQSTDSSLEVVAIKVIKLPAGESQDEGATRLEQLPSELGLWSQCKHDHILQLYEVFYAPPSPTSLFPGVWISQELADRSLADIVGLIPYGLEFPEDAISRITLDICSALKVLHSKRIIHRDVRSDNILLHHLTGTAKLSDFTHAVQLDASGPDSKRISVVGTAYWMAPELIQAKPYDVSVDLWSMGATLYEMCQGQPPYVSFDPLKAIAETSVKGLPALQDDEDKWSYELKGFLRRCTNMDVGKRGTVQELMKSDFLRSCKQKEKENGGGREVVLELMEQAKILEETLGDEEEEE